MITTDRYKKVYNLTKNWYNLTIKDYIMSRERTRSPKADPAPENNKAKRRFIELTYRLIEYKIMYYYPEYIKAAYHSHLTIDDHSYDALEIEYLKLCLQLGYPNTIVHKGYPGLEDVPGSGMEEVDFTRPAVHLIMRKWGVQNWQDKCYQLDAQVRAKVAAADKKFRKEMETV